MRELLDHGEDNAQHQAPRSSGNVPSSSPLQPSADSNPRGHSDFVPAGGNPGLVRPAGSLGRRGSVGKVVSLAGAAAARAISWDEGPHEGDLNGEVDHSRPCEGGMHHHVKVCLRSCRDCVGNHRPDLTLTFDFFHPLSVKPSMKGSPLRRAKHVQSTRNASPPLSLPFPPPAHRVAPEPLGI